MTTAVDLPDSAKISNLCVLGGGANSEVFPVPMLNKKGKGGV